MCACVCLHKHVHGCVIVGCAHPHMCTVKCILSQFLHIFVQFCAFLVNFCSSFSSFVLIFFIFVHFFHFVLFFRIFGIFLCICIFMFVRACTFVCVFVRGHGTCPAHVCTGQTTDRQTDRQKNVYYYIGLLACKK